MNRQPAGRPDGGEFTTVLRADSEVELMPPLAMAAEHERGSDLNGS